MREGRALAVHLVAYLGGQLSSQRARAVTPQPFTFWLSQLREHFHKGGSPALSSLLTLKCVFGDTIRYSGMREANSAGWGSIRRQEGGPEQLQALQEVRAMPGVWSCHIGRICDVYVGYMGRIWSLYVAYIEHI